MRRGLILAALVTVLMVAGCDSGVVTETGTGSIPPAAADALTIDSPGDGDQVTSSALLVKGTAPDGADVVRDVSFGPDDHTTATGGQWSMLVQLDQGENLLTFRIGDDKATSATLRVIYAPGTAQASSSAEATPPAQASSSAESTPEAEPTEAPTPKPLSVKVTERTTSVPRNATASVTIKTASGAQCMIAVYYPSGISEAKGLGPKKANSSGVITWKWQVGGNTSKGTHQIDIDCEKGELTGSTSTSFRVR